MFFQATVKNTKGEPIKGAKAELVGLFADVDAYYIADIDYFSGKQMETAYTTFNIPIVKRQMIGLV